MTISADRIDAIYNNDYKKDMRREIEALPPVFPARPEGKWIEKDKTPGYTKWECNNCGSTFKNSQKPWYNFCPNCGADMKGKQDETD